jgi:cobalt-zinc-cadmium efflux system membrane fusion protein
VRSYVAGIVRYGLAQLPGLLVLATLGALMVWGHHHKWKVPRFAELRGAGEAPGSEGGGETSALKIEVRKVPPDPRVPAGSSAALYRIRFQNPDTAKKTGLKVVKVEGRPLAQYVTAPGRLDFDQTRYAELAPRASGTVWRVYKQEGDWVNEGDVLALVASAAVGQAKAEFLQALVQRDLRRDTWERMQRVTSIPEYSVRAAAAAHHDAKIRLANSQVTLLNLGLPVPVKDLEGLPEEQISRRLQRLGLPDSLLAGLDPETVPGNLLPLRAPFAGEVIKRDMVVGEVVDTTTPQFVVADVRTLWIILDVRLEDAALLPRGRPAPVLLDTGTAGKVARGELTWVSPAVDKVTRTVRVRGRVANPERQLRPDTFGTGRIEVRASSRAVAVPSAAIQRDGETELVFVRRGDGTFEARPVRPGISAAEYTEIRAGVRAGEEVVTTGSHLLKSEIVRSRLSGGGDDKVTR